MRTFGKLREKIKQKFNNFSEFADAIGMDRSTLSKKLNGKVGWTSTEIESICNILGIPMSAVGEYFFYE